MSEERTIVRAFELPVQAIECDGRDGWKLLRECWDNSTILANWTVQQLIRHDSVRLPRMEKFAECPRPVINGKRKKGLYGLATEQFGFVKGWWAGACVSASSIIRGVEKKYMAERFAVIWRRERAPCTYRYPHPWPVHAQAWLGAGFDSGKPWITVALPGGHARLRLRGGPEFSRQLGLFRQVVEGKLPRLQLVIRQQGASAGCHRPTLTDNRRPCRAMVKMVARLTAPPKKDGRTLVLLTDPEAFWVAELDGRPAWVLNNDYMRQGIAAHHDHLRRLQRLGEDAKSERRLGSNLAPAIRDRSARYCEKHRKRMASWTHEAAAHLVGFAQRQGVAEILYLDRDKGFMPKFPWHELLAKVIDKCRMAGIEVYTESGIGHLPEPAEEGGEIDIIQDGDDKWQRITRLREAAAGKVLKARKRSRSHPKVSARCAT